MTDRSAIERYMREANPIPHLDAVAVEELARSAAATQARRAEYLREPEVARPGIPVWRRAWAVAAAFVVILLAVGTVALVLRADTPSAIDGPAPPQPRDFSLAAGWERVDDPLSAQIGNWCASPEAGPHPACVFSPLPGGGFHFVNFHDEAEAWSPDGLAWFEGPPRGLAMAFEGEVPEPPAVMFGDTAVVAGADDASVWVGDPESGEWQSIGLDRAGLFLGRIVAMAASPEAVLVVGQGLPESGAMLTTVAWIVDPMAGTSVRHKMAEVSTYVEAGDIVAAWAGGNWVVAPVRQAAEFDLLYSDDGASWQPLELPDTGVVTGNAEAEEPTIQSLVVGEPGIVAFGDLSDYVVESYNGLWFSADGVQWQIVQHISAWPAALTYSSELGFVVATDGAEETLVSADGITWRKAGVLPWTFDGGAERVLGASGTTLLSAGADGVWRWTPDAATAVSVPEPARPREAQRPPVWTSVDGITWTQGSDAEAFVGDDVSVFDIATGGPGYVAVGTADESAAVWTSPDGLDWSRVPHDAVVFGGGKAVHHMEAVISGGPGFVAVGFAFDAPGKRGIWPAVWTSADGLLWSRAALDGEEREEGWLHDVVAGGPGFVAVGDARQTAAVWTSPDGLTWLRVPHDPEVFGYGATAMNAVATGGPGLVAVGSVHRFSSAAVWTSPDGVTWSRVPHDEEVFGGVGGQVIADVIAAGPGLVAVGQDEPDSISAVGGIRAAVWTSSDGLIWTRVPHESALFGENEDERHMKAIARGGHGLVAVGTDVWTSPDGISWTWIPSETARAADAPLAQAEGFGLNGFTFGPGGFVAVGSEL